MNAVHRDSRYDGQAGRVNWLKLEEIAGLGDGEVASDGVEVEVEVCPNGNAVGSHGDLQNVVAGITALVSLGGFLGDFKVGTRLGEGWNSSEKERKNRHMHAG